MATSDGVRGLEVTEPAALPFLLAARAQALVSSQALSRKPPARAFFAEGLSSSFEAYRQTRMRTEAALVDRTARRGGRRRATQTTMWYLRQLDGATCRG